MCLPETGQAQSPSQSLRGMRGWREEEKGSTRTSGMSSFFKRLMACALLWCVESRWFEQRVRHASDKFRGAMTGWSDENGSTSVSDKVACRRERLWRVQCYVRYVLVRWRVRMYVRGKLYMGFGSATVNDVNWRDKAATRWRQGKGKPLPGTRAGPGTRIQLVHTEMYSVRTPRCVWLDANLASGFGTCS